VWLVSFVVLAVLGYVLTGRELPDRLTEVIETYLPRDGSPARDVTALAMLAGAAVGLTPLHRIVRYLATLVHELGHATAAGILGGRPSHITISTDASGLAVYQPPLHWGRFRASIVSAAGYPAPALASLAAVRALQQGHAQAWFVFATGVLALAVLLLIRNFWGFFWTSAVVAAAVYGVRELDVRAIGAAVAAIAGFLAVEGSRHAFHQFVVLRHVRNTGCDAESISRMLRVPALLVSGLFLVGTAALGGYSLNLGIRDYWPELREFVTDFL
jgi:hypothetical protein